MPQLGESLRHGEKSFDVEKIGCRSVRRDGGRRKRHAGGLLRRGLGRGSRSSAINRRCATQVRSRVPDALGIAVQVGQGEMGDEKGCDAARSAQPA